MSRLEQSRHRRRDDRTPYEPQFQHRRRSEWKYARQEEHRYVCRMDAGSEVSPDDKRSRGDVTQPSRIHHRGVFSRQGESERPAQPARDPSIARQTASSVIGMST